MTEDKGDNDANVSETDIPETILTPMSAVRDEKTPGVDDKQATLIERFYKLFYNLFSGW